MSDRLEVDIQELRDHASGLRAVHERFAAIRQASGHIFQADEAYGQLCQFLPPILEGRHLRQDEIVDILAENVQLLAEAVDGCADAYEEADEAAADDMKSIEAEL